MKTKQKAKAIEIMKQMDIYAPYIEGFEKEGKPIIVPIPEDALRTIAFCRQVIKDGLASTKDLINAAMTATTMIDGVLPAAIMRSAQPQAK